MDVKTPTGIVAAEAVITQSHTVFQDLIMTCFIISVHSECINR